MRDGVLLETLLWRARGARPSPLLLYRTPYGSAEESAEHRHTIDAALARGLSVAFQDVRGRHGSQGDFTPYRQEGRDGHDAIEWLATQSWCDGRVGMFGLSYPAAAQWLAALERPPHLGAIAPAMCFSRADHFFSFGGAFDLSWPSWAAANIVPDARRRRGLPAAGADEVVADALRLPLRHEGPLSEAMPEYLEWLSHPPGDPWWAWADVRARIDRVDAAVLHLSGWHDEAYGPIGAIENFSALVRARRGPARTELVLGPWTHGVEAVGAASAGLRTFGPSARVDYDGLVLDFLEEHLCAARRRRARAPVRAYVMGADRWVECASWPPATRDEVWLLGPGSLGAATPAGVSSFVADPADPPSIDGDPSYGAQDLSPWDGRADVLRFDGPAFHEDTDVLGTVGIELYVTSDAPSVDVYAWLVDVAPDGRALTLTSPGNVVARVSTAGHAREPAWVGLPHVVTGHRFPRGHRARLYVAAAFKGALSPNLQTGESELVSARMARAVVGVHHSAAWPSRVSLPVLPRGDGTTRRASLSATGGG
jgi:putative CocE/NonD family hydrolase